MAAHSSCSIVMTVRRCTCNTFFLLARRFLLSISERPQDRLLHARKQMPNSARKTSRARFTKMAHSSAAPRVVRISSVLFVLAMTVILTLHRNSVAAGKKMPNHLAPRRSTQIHDGFGINSDLPRDPYLPWYRWWWTRIFDAGISFIRIGQYENSSDYTCAPQEFNGWYRSLTSLQSAPGVSLVGTAA